MRENEKEREELKASRQTLLVPKEKSPKTKTAYNVSCGGFYSQTPITNYQNNKTNTITMGENREYNQKVIKKSQKQNEQCRRLRKFSVTTKFSQHCEIFTALRDFVKFSSSALSGPLFFWFLNYSS